MMLISIIEVDEDNEDRKGIFNAGDSIDWKFFSRYTVICGYMWN